MDVVKKDMQLNKVRATAYTPVLRSLYSDGGVMRFFRGAHLAIGEVIASRLVAFGMTEFFKNTMPKRWDEEKTGPFKRAAVSSFLGAWFKAAVFTPIDAIKTRFQTLGRVEKGVESPRTIISIASQMYRLNSIAGLYRGFTNLGMKASLNFVPFFVGMDLAQTYIPVPEDPWMRQLRNGAVGSLVTLTSDLMTYPLDVVKNFRQASIFKSASENIALGHQYLEPVKQQRPAGVLGRIWWFFMHPQGTIPLMGLLIRERGFLGMYRGFWLPNGMPGPRPLALVVSHP